MFAAEPPERFVAFGAPILAPITGRVAAVHDGAPDHEARRSPFALTAYAIGQASRYRRGGAVGVAGNHIVIEIAPGGPFVALVHLRCGSLRVAVGDPVRTGQQLAECGNSGNSTQPHVHVQAMDGLEMTSARGLPIVFRDYRERRGNGVAPKDVDAGVPAERAVVESR